VEKRLEILSCGSNSDSATFKPKIVGGRCPFSFPSLPLPPIPSLPLSPSLPSLSLSGPFPCPSLLSPLLSSPPVPSPPFPSP